MKLWYILIGLDRESEAFDTEYYYDFTLRTRFISNFLSKPIRKHRFDTNGEFNMISVRLGQTAKNPQIIHEDVLRVSLPFDQARYEKIKGTADHEYYLEMFEEGFRKAAEFKRIPLDTLLDLINEFRNNGCRNEWLHKKKRFKEHDIEVALNCFFTTLDFKLVATIRRLSKKELLCSGVILQTEPNEVCFDHEFKDVFVDNENIVVTNFVDRPRFLIDLKKTLKKELVWELVPYHEED